MGNGESSETNVQPRNSYNESNVFYLLSSDIEEVDRQQRQHYVFKHIFKCNVSAPVEQMLKEGCKVLDVGCGAGIWILELSTEFTKSEFFGVDMLPVFPDAIKPFNSNFIKANMLEGLPFNSEEFDYVHISFMNACFNDDQWQNIVIPEVIRVLKPNGWLEFYEVDVVQFEGGPLVERLCNNLQKFLYSAGLNPRLPNLFKQWLSSYPCFKDIGEFYVYPFIGEWRNSIIDEGIEGKCSETSACVKESDSMKVSKEYKYSDNFLSKNTNIKSKDEVELGVILKEVIKEYYILYSEDLSKCMDVSREEFLNIVEECFEREVFEYDTRMKFLRVICRKE